MQPSWDDVISVQPTLTQETSVTSNQCDDRCAEDCQYGQPILDAPADLVANTSSGSAAGHPTRSRASRYHVEGAMGDAREASRLVGQMNAPKKAQKLMAGCSASDKLPPTDRARADYENDAARKIELYAWSFGGITLVTSILKRLIDRPAQRAILAYADTIPASQSAYLSKDEVARKRIVLNIRAFLKHICPAKKRTKVDQQVIDSVLASIVDSEKSMNRDRMGRAFARVLKVTRHMINRASKVRDLNINESPYTGWAHCVGKQYLNAITDHDRQLITDVFHSDDFSSYNNDVKGGTRIPVGVDELGRFLYDVHTNRQWNDPTRANRFDELTGRNRQLSGFRVSLTFDMSIDDFEAEDSQIFKLALTTIVVGAVGRALTKQELTYIRLAPGTLTNTADVYFSKNAFREASVNTAVRRAGKVCSDVLSRAEFEQVMRGVGFGCTATPGQLDDAYATAGGGGGVTAAAIRKHALPHLDAAGCMLDRADQIDAEVVQPLRELDIGVCVGPYSYAATKVDCVAVPTGLSVAEPHAVWLAVEKSTATEKRPRGIRGSTKLAASCECACIKQPKQGICVCPKCFIANEWLKVYRAQYPGWIQRYNAANPGAGECKKCAGGCLAADTPYRSIFSSMTSAMTALTCKPKRRPGCEVQELDPVTQQPTGKFVEWSVAPKACYDGSCKANCGWDAAAASCPVIKTTATVTSCTNETHTEDLEYRGCPTYENSTELITVRDFVKVERVTADPEEDAAYSPDDKKSKAQTELLPVTMPRTVFAARLREKLKHLGPHYHRLRIEAQSDRRERELLRVKVADGRSPSWFPSCAGTATEVLECEVDWAAAPHHYRDANTTCSIEESSALAVSVYKFGSHYLEDVDIPSAKQRKNISKKHDGRDDYRLLKTQNVVFYTYCEDAGSAVQFHSFTPQHVQMLQNGQLELPKNLQGKGIEWVHDRQRVLGSDTSVELPDGFSEAEEPIDLTGGRSFSHLNCKNDGCCCQFNCRNRYRGDQSMPHRCPRCPPPAPQAPASAPMEVEPTEPAMIQYTVHRKPPGHGKAIVDAVGALPSQAVCTAAKGGFNYPAGTRAYMYACALLLTAPRPPKGGGVSLNENEVTHYVYGYIPGKKAPKPRGGTGAFDYASATATEAVPGISSVFFQRSIPGENILQAMLLMRGWDCFCDPCLELKYRAAPPTIAEYKKCLMLEDFDLPWVQQIKGGISSENVGIAYDSQAAFWDAIKPNTPVIIRTLDTDDEPYWPAVVMKPPSDVFGTGCTWKIVEAETFAGASQPKGTMAVRILWFTFVREDRDGTRWYRKWDTEKASLHSSTTIAIKAQKYLTKESFKFDNSKRLWYLSHAAHADIIRWGGLQ